MDTEADGRSNSSASNFGSILREWRRARGASQLDLALICGLSQRHLSFLESGRSRPSRGMVFHLASAMGVSPQQRNAMLLIAGFAPVYAKRTVSASDARPIDNTLLHALRQQEPFPGIVVDSAYNILCANDAAEALIAFLLPDMDADSALRARKPLNAVELVLHPDRLRPSIENWDELVGLLIPLLHAEAMLRGTDTGVSSLLKRVLSLPGVVEIAQSACPERESPSTFVVRFRKGETRLALLPMITTLGTPLDLSLQSPQLELFFPADAATEAWFKRVAQLE